jgi:tetratricopeptide (TPR) repeat protein
MAMISENLRTGLAWHSHYFNTEGLIGAFLVFGFVFFGIIWLLSFNRPKKPAAAEGGEAAPRFRDPAEDTARTVALYQQVLSLAQREGDRAGEAEALIAIGCTYFLADDLDQALVHHQQALVLARDAADDRAITRALRYIGQIHLSRRDATQAHSFFELALTSARQSGDAEDISDALEDLADSYFALGQDAQGNDCRRQVIGDEPLPSRRRAEAMHLWRSARVLQEMNRPREATANAEEALAIFDRIDDPHTDTVRAALQEWQTRK